MKKSFMTRALAAGLSLAMAFSLSAATNVTVASAATTPGMVAKQFAVRTGGAAKSYKATAATQKSYKISKAVVGNSSKATVKVNSSKKSIKVTPGTVTKDTSTVVTISFKNTKTKKVTTKKYRCAVKAAKTEEEQQPTTTDEFALTSLKATKANELTATFANDVASEGAVTVKVNKAGSTTDITGTIKYTDSKTLVFTAAANFTAGTYELTATDASDSTKTSTLSCVVENEKVAEIVIKAGDDKTALTSADKKEAYVYYDVLNQYGESIRTSTSVTWTLSSGNDYSVNKSTGKITAKRADGNDFTYGSYLYVTGVYTKTGVSVQEQLTIGMQQNLDTIDIYGFVKSTDKNTILEKLPTNFQAGQYVLVFQAKDQNANVMDVDSYSVATDVTFISDNVLLVKSEFKAPSQVAGSEFSDTLTIAGEEYACVTVEPGQYVDKGGEVNITAIANNTGNKTVKNYVIGNAALLKSVVLSQPSTVVSDGQQDVEIPYTAYDTDGNQVTSYETIARSTNTLNLTAATGTLTLKEKNDGTAQFLWSDTKATTETGWGATTTYDEIDRSIALATVVVGGESNNLILAVSDKARPVAIKSVELKTDATTAIVEADSDTLEIADFVFVDQYGQTMGEAGESNDFFDYVASDAWNGSNYAVKAVFNKTNSNFDLSANTVATQGAVLITSGNQVAQSTKAAIWTANTSGSVANETVKYSIVSNKSTNTDQSVAAFDSVGKTLNVSYSVVPMKEVKNVAITKLNKQYINLGLGAYSTGAQAGMESKDLVTSLGAISSGTYASAKNPDIDTDHEQDITVTGSYNGVSLIIPGDYIQFSAKKFDMDGVTNSSTNTITASTISKAALTLGDFYDATATNLARKDGSDTITAHVFTITTGASVDLTDDTQVKKYQHAAPTTTLTFSDAAPVPTSLGLVESTVVNPVDAVIDATSLASMGAVYEDGVQQKDDDGYWKAGLVSVKDQYNKSVDAVLSMNVSDITENTNDLAHLDKSFAVGANDTSSANITGVEIGDTFTVTITASNDAGSASGSVKVTVGSDEFANITAGYNPSADEYFRKNVLHYAY
jgi:hypothetical protein